MALLMFNLGVEIGQAALIIALLLIGWLTARAGSGLLTGLRRAGAYACGIAGAYWAIERLAAPTGLLLA